MGTYSQTGSGYLSGDGALQVSMQFRVNSMQFRVNSAYLLVFSNLNINQDSKIRFSSTVV